MKTAALLLCVVLVGCEKPQTQLQWKPPADGGSGYAPTDKCYSNAGTNDEMTQVPCTSEMMK